MAEVVRLRDRVRIKMEERFAMTEEKLMAAERGGLVRVRGRGRGRRGKEDGDEDEDEEGDGSDDDDDGHGVGAAADPAAESPYRRAPRPAEGDVARMTDVVTPTTRHLDLIREQVLMRDIAPRRMDPPVDRVLRVYVSGLTPDVSGYLSSLLGSVIPAFERRCAVSHVAVVAVDLGDLDKAVASGAWTADEAMSLRVAEIARCDIFIGLVGNAVGAPVRGLSPAWVQANGSWAAPLAEAGVASALEYELAFARSRPLGGRAVAHPLVYLRDPAHNQSKRIEAATRGWSVRLKEVRSAIVSGGAGAFLVRDGLRDADSFSRKVFADLMDVLGSRHPWDGSPRPDAAWLARAVHDAFGRAACTLTADRSFLTSSVTRLLFPSQHHQDSIGGGGGGGTGSGGIARPAVLLGGPAGCGKATVLARVLEGFLAGEGSRQALTIAHFAGAPPHPRDRTLQAVLGRILGELRSECLLLDREVPRSVEGMIEALPAWLQDARDSIQALSGGGGGQGAGPLVVLVVAGLHHIDCSALPGDPAEALVSWLPERLPAGVAVALSLRSDHPAMEHLRRRELLTVMVPSLSPAEKGSIVDRVLLASGKVLPAAGKEKLFSHSSSDRVLDSPRAVGLAANLLRLYPVKEKLNDVLKQVAAAASVGTLYDLVLARVERVCAGVPGAPDGLVGELLRLVAASRVGLPEAHLRRLAGAGVAGVAVSALLHCMDRWVLSAAGVLFLADAGMIQAIHARYGGDHGALQARRTLVNHWDASGRGPGRACEMLAALLGLGPYGLEPLSQRIAMPKLVAEAVEDGAIADVVEAFEAVAAERGRPPLAEAARLLGAAAAKASGDDDSARARVMWACGELLVLLGEPKTAAALLGESLRLLDTANPGSDTVDTVSAAALCLAGLQPSLQLAEKVLAQALAITCNSRGVAHWRAHYLRFRIAKLHADLKDKGSAQTARSMKEVALAGFRGLLGPAHPLTTLVDKLKV